MTDTVNISAASCAPLSANLRVASGSASRKAAKLSASLMAASTSASPRAAQLSANRQVAPLSAPIQDACKLSAVLAQSSTSESASVPNASPLPSVESVTDLRADIPSPDEIPTSHLKTLARGCERNPAQAPLCLALRLFLLAHLTQTAPSWTSDRRRLALFLSGHARRSHSMTLRLQFLWHAFFFWASTFQVHPKPEWTRKQRRDNWRRLRTSKKVAKELLNFRPDPGNALRGAQQQSSTTPQDMMRDHITSKLTDFNVPTTIAVSIAMLVSSIICTIIGILRTPKKHRSNFHIASILLQIGSLISQVLHISFTSVTVPGLTEFVQEKATETLDIISPINTSSDLRSYVMMRAMSIEQANLQISKFLSAQNQFTCPKIPEKFLTQPLPAFPLSREDYDIKFRTLMHTHQVAINYWLPKTIVRLWQLNAEEEMMFNMICSYSRTDMKKARANINRPRLSSVSESDAEIPKIESNNDKFVPVSSDDESTPPPPSAKPRSSIEVEKERQDLIKVMFPPKQQTPPPPTAPNKIWCDRTKMWLVKKEDGSFSPYVSDEEYDDDLEEFLSDHDLLTGPTDPELDAEFDKWESERLQGASQQADVSILRYISSQLIGIIASLSVTVVLFLSGKTVDFATISRNWAGIDFLTEKFSTICEKLGQSAGAKSPAETLQEKVQGYIEDVNRLLEIPHTTYAIRGDLRADLDKKCNEVEAFLKQPMDPKMCDKNVLSSLYTALNASRVDIHRAQYAQGARQEPRMWIFTGPGAVGKTKTMQNLASQIGNIKYPTIDQDRRSVSLTARSKYFPLLNGEPIWTIDEIGASKDYSEELILRDVRGLCSSARFGADTAEIAGKNQTANPHVILATTNTPPDTIVTRLGDLCGPEATEPTVSRMTFISCERNTSDYGPLKTQDRDNQLCDKSGEMNHVRYVIHKWNPATKQFVAVSPQDKRYKYKAIREMIINKMNILEADHLAYLAMQGASPQAGQSRTHFVVNFNGLPGHGKGRALETVLPELRKFTNYPVLKLEKSCFNTEFSEFTKRQIVIADDIFSCNPKVRAQQELWWMNFYNNVLYDGSIILVSSNIVRKTHWPAIKPAPGGFAVASLPEFLQIFVRLFTTADDIPCPFVRIHPKFSVNLSEPGFLRRIGFTGFFVDNNTNLTDLNFTVSNDVYYQQCTLSDDADLNPTLMVMLCLLPLYFISFITLILAEMCMLVYIYVRFSSMPVAKYDRSQLFQVVFSKYQSFLTAFKQVIVQYAAINMTATPEISVTANSVTELMAISPTSIPAHVFSNADRYNTSNLSWKILVTPAASTALLSFSDKFLCSAPSDTVESVIEFMKTLRGILVNINVNPVVHVTLANLGTFYLNGNVLSIDRRVNSGIKYETLCLPKHLAIIPAVDEFADVKSIYLPWSKIAAYHMYNETLLDIEDHPIVQLSIVTEAINSVEVLTCKEYKEARAAEIDNRVSANIKTSALRFRDEFLKFSESTTGKICIGLVAALATIGVIYAVYNAFSSDEEPKKSKKKRRRHVATSCSEDGSDPDSEAPESSDSEEEEEIVEQKKGKKAKKGGEKKKPPLSPQKKNSKKGKKKDTKQEKPLSPQDLDKIGKHQKAHMRFFLNRTKFEANEIVDAVPQSTDDLPDMNGYDEFKNVLNGMQDKCKKNECYVIALPCQDLVITYKDKAKRNAEIENNSRCYGLFVDNFNVMTVGHMVAAAHGKKKCLYVFNDELGLKAFRLDLVKDFSKLNRDISFWTIPHSKERSKLSAFPSIRKYFVDSLWNFPEFSDTILRRYAKNKEQQYLYATMMYYPEEESSVMADGTPYKIREYGFAWFSFCLLALTTYGDCGLPYFNVVDDGNNKQIKLSGIHCMGNVKDTVSIGIAAIVVQDDFNAFDAYLKKHSTEECNKCPLKEMTLRDPLPEKDNSDPEEGIVHKVLWNNDHTSTIENVFREIKWLKDYDQHFKGTFRKSHGDKAVSHPHSHMHYLKNKFFYQDLSPAYGVWVERESDFGAGLVLESNFNIGSLKVLRKFFEENEWIGDFIMFFERKAYTTRAGKNIVKERIHMCVLTYTLTEKEKSDLLAERCSRQCTDGWAPPELDAVLDAAIASPAMHDVPISPNQDTVVLNGSFAVNWSRTPAPGFKRIKYSELLVTPPGKVPFCSDADLAPSDQLKQLVVNHAGELCARTSQSVQWQGKHFAPPLTIAKLITDEYYEHIIDRYSNLREFTDAEVLRGGSLDNFGLGRLELNKSIGFSLQALFYVTLKSDVLNCDEDGVYSWKTTPAALYAKEWYRQCKTKIRSDQHICTIYLELVKMEKLKPEKNFLGRIFCAADLVDILIQRKFLGSFVSRSTLEDDSVGVGSDPFVVFHGMAMQCRAKGNVFTADYKRWDKTVPRWLFVELGKMLDRANPKNAHFSTMFKTLYHSIHVSGRTIFTKDRGMPSGALVTANLNSKLNDFALFSCFVILGQRKNIDISYSSYSNLVYRKFYGDDVIVAVHESIKKWFNMITVRDCLSEVFGFVMDSSEKDGNVRPFMEWPELSWCSRYFRKLDDYNYYVGAIKKITIGSLLHWTHKRNDHLIVAVQLNSALYEAAAWEIEYFEQVKQDVILLRERNPELRNWIAILPRSEYQQDMYNQGMKGNLIRRMLSFINNYCLDDVQSGSSTAMDITQNYVSVIDVAPLTPILENLLIFYLTECSQNNIMGNIQVPPREFTEDEITTAQTASSDYVSLLNQMAQAKEITMPVYTFTQQPDTVWSCNCSTRRNRPCASLISGVGLGHNMKIAKHAAAYQVWYQLNYVEEQRKRMSKCMQGAKQEMNLSPGDQVPQVKTSGFDVSMTAGSHVFSNTQFAQGVTDLNPTAFALNNIAQTGAPFDIKDSVYSIYQLEQSTTVTSVQSVGSEIFRLSLDPKTRPAIHQSYIKLHEAHVPSVEFGVYINGTAGALGTLKIGWVRDISKSSYSLTEIQQIASQDVSLCQSSTVAFVVRDIRKSALYRDVDDDSAPYPGVVALVSNTITNVQRNDSVSYPIQIYSRLAPDYQLAVPRALSERPNTFGDLSLSSYLVSEVCDFAISVNAITNSLSEYSTYADCGWNTGAFHPVFNISQLACVKQTEVKRIGTNNGMTVCVPAGVTASALAIDTVKNLYNSADMELGLAYVPNRKLYFAYGEIPKRYVPGRVEDVTLLSSDPKYDSPISFTFPSATYYSVPKFNIKYWGSNYTCTIAAVYDAGIVLEFVNADIDWDNVTTDIRDGFQVVCYPWFGEQAPGRPLGTCDDNFLVGPGILDLRQKKFVACFRKETTYVNLCTVEAYTPRINFTPVPVIGFEENYPALFNWTYLATGNQASTVAAPTGFSRFIFARPGTSLNKSLPITPILAPGVQRLITALTRYQEQIGAPWLQMDLFTDAITTEFSLLFNNGIFLIRSNQENLIYISINVSECSIRNIKAISSPNVVPIYIPKIPPWQNWISTQLTLKTFSKLCLNGASFQMEAAMIAGEAIGSAAKMAASFYAMKQNNLNLQLNRDLQLQLAQLRAGADIRLQKQKLENQLQLKGMTSASAEGGNADVLVTQGQKDDQQQRLEDSHMGANDAALRSAANLSPREGVSPQERLASSNLNPEAAEFIPQSSQNQTPQLDDAVSSTTEGATLDSLDTGASVASETDSPRASIHSMSTVAYHSGNSASLSREPQTGPANINNQPISATNPYVLAQSTSGTKYPLARGSIIPNARFPSASGVRESVTESQRGFNSMSFGGKGGYLTTE